MCCPVLLHFPGSSPEWGSLVWGVPWDGAGMEPGSLLPAAQLCSTWLRGAGLAPCRLGPGLDGGVRHFLSCQLRNAVLRAS